jgi:hypothetical protein
VESAQKVGGMEQHNMTLTSGRKPLTVEQFHELAA